MLVRVAAVASFLILAACNHKPDPLAQHRAACEALQKAGQLKKGLALETCAQQLRVAADAADPKVRAGEILDRLAALSAKGAVRPVSNPRSSPFATPPSGSSSSASPR